MTRLPLLLLTCLLGLLALAGSAQAYDTPAGGKWKVDESFQQVTGGSMRLAGNGRKVTKLKLTLGPDTVESCGGPTVTLTKALRIDRFKKANGRYAVGKMSGSGLIVAVKAKVSVGGKAVKGAKIVLLWDDGGRLMNSGRLTLPQCALSFTARK